MLIDLATEQGKELARRLRMEDIIWLIVQRENAAPYPTPVWFLWEEEHDSILVYSRARAKKLQHIQQYPQVSLHFNSSYRGSDIVIMTGIASLDADTLPPIDNAAYIAKYGRTMKMQINMTALQFSDIYSAGYRVKLDSVNI